MTTSSLEKLPNLIEKEAHIDPQTVFVLAERANGGVLRVDRGAVLLTVLFDGRTVGPWWSGVEMVTNIYSEPIPQVRTIRVGKKDISSDYRSRADASGRLRSPREGVDVATVDGHDAMLLPAVWMAVSSDALQFTADKYLCLLEDAMGDKDMFKQAMQLINDWCEEVGIK